MTSIASRIEAAYMRRTGKPTPHGARAWFARQARVRPYTVSRWLGGLLPFSGPPLAVLELLEEAPARADRCICCERGTDEVVELFRGPLGMLCTECVTTLRRALL